MYICMYKIHFMLLYKIPIYDSDKYMPYYCMFAYTWFHTIYFIICSYRNFGKLNTFFIPDFEFVFS